ncbi:MAG: 2'-5' RNA ligase family protein [Spirochaetes bacterium]|nr:2'-5' RNA ligase family protein [Spirochaetota bacterium]
MTREGEPPVCFRRARASFLAVPATIPSITGDFKAWHRGRPRFAFWAIALDPPAVRQAIAAALPLFEGKLLPDWRRQPHVTLTLCGFPSAAPRQPQDWGPAELEDALRRLSLSKRTPFTLQIGGVGSFTTAPFLEIHDPEGALLPLREALGRRPDDMEDSEYTPHLTLGLYGGVWPTQTLSERMGAMHRRHPLPIPVESISLMSYEARDICGPLSTHGSWDLRRGIWSGLDPDPFRAPAHDRGSPG